MGYVSLSKWSFLSVFVFCLGLPACTTGSEEMDINVVNFDPRIKPLSELASLLPVRFERPSPPIELLGNALAAVIYRETSNDDNSKPKGPPSLIWKQKQETYIGPFNWEIVQKAYHFFYSPKKINETPIRKMVESLFSRSGFVTLNLTLLSKELDQGHHFQHIKEKILPLDISKNKKNQWSCRFFYFWVLNWQFQSIMGINKVELTFGETLEVTDHPLSVDGPWTYVESLDF